MDVRRKKQTPPIKATLTGKEARKMLKEFDRISDLFRYAPLDIANFDTPILDDFISQLETVIEDN